MGYVSTFLAAIFCATAPLAAIEASESKIEQTENRTKLGKEVVSTLRQAYERGDYNQFLSEMDASYQQAIANHDLDGLIQMRQKEIPTSLQDQWEGQFFALQTEKNKELLSAISDEDNSLFAQKVRSLAAILSTPEQEKAVSKLNSLVIKAPKTGVNPDENRLIDIDLEYEYKSLHAQLPSSETSPLAMQDQQTILRMEKMDKMVEAAKSFKDLSLKQAVGLAAANFDARLARNLDGADLNVLVKKQVKPANETEEQVFAILTIYQQQFSELMKQIANENQ